MRDIKFQFIYHGMSYSSKNSDKPVFKKVYSLEQLITKPLRELCDIHDDSILIAKRQFTGLTDKNGVDIYEGDILNIVDTLPRKGCSYLTMFRPVIFNSGCFEVNPCEDTGLFLCEIASDEHQEGSHRCFVAGNIHENPELLKTNKIEE